MLEREEDLREKILSLCRECAQCGACRPVCPVHRLTRWEEHSPRGKLNLYQAILKGEVAPSAANTAPLRQCLLCGRCQDNCPKKLEITRALKMGRALLKGPLPGRIVSRILARPELPRWAGAVWPLQKLLPPGASWRLKNLKRLPPLRAALPAMAAIKGKKNGPRLGLFLGCMATYARPQLAEKAMSLLRRLGEVIPLGGCCGLAAQSAGETHLLRQSARDLYAAGTGLSMIVTLCTSCAASLNYEHAQITAPRRLPPVLDIVQLLPDIAGDADMAGQAFLHLPCHLEANVRQSLPRWLAAAGMAARLIDDCCGGGGLLPLNNPQLSRRITPKPADPDVPVLTTCSGCYLNWLQTDAKQVLHPVELIDGV
jgi:glycolate oxidase iron-sulfur subunit